MRIYKLLDQSTILTFLSLFDTQSKAISYKLWSIKMIKEKRVYVIVADIAAAAAAFEKSFNLNRFWLCRISSSIHLFWKLFVSVYEWGGVILRHYYENKLYLQIWVNVGLDFKPTKPFCCLCGSIRNYKSIDVLKDWSDFFVVLAYH